MAGIFDQNQTPQNKKRLKLRKGTGHKTFEVESPYQNWAQKKHRTSDKTKLAVLDSNRDPLNSHQEINPQKKTCKQI